MHECRIENKSKIIINQPLLQQYLVKCSGGAKFETMSKLSLKDVKIALPNDFNAEFTDAEFVEWLEFRLGATYGMSYDNPLYAVELCDCNVEIGNAILDGKELSL